MREIVEVDKSGRITIPKSLRKELAIGARTKFILAKTSQGLLLLQKLETMEIAQKLEEELSGKNIDGIVKQVRKEIRAKIKTSYQDLLT
ncbi:MAG: hypothetical protein HY619_07930 [Thaumarchaeota archaeon]|nr:hypothetical protein [Nitrososphaerota archaeon]